MKFKHVSSFSFKGHSQGSTVTSWYLSLYKILGLELAIVTQHTFRYNKYVESPSVGSTTPPKLCSSAFYPETVFSHMTLHTWLFLNNIIKSSVQYTSILLACLISEGYLDFNWKYLNINLTRNTLYIIFSVIFPTAMSICLY